MAKKTIVDSLAEIRNTIDNAQEDAEVFDSGERGAGSAAGRVRKALQEVKMLAQNGRKLVIAIKNDRKMPAPKAKKKK